VYNVSEFLPEFFTSLEEQTFGLDRVEVILVDDGSTDASAALIDAWTASGPQRLALHKENGGQGSARNLGLGHATGTWVSFPDPDDILDRKYLAQVASAIGRYPHADMLSGNRKTWYEELGVRGTAHPVSHMYQGDHEVNLARRPQFFAGHAASCFFRRSELAASGLEFNTEIRPNYEDGHFCVQYLLPHAEPRVVFVASAVYNYRKRANGTSTLDNSGTKATRFTVVPREGYLADLQAGTARYGRAPAWLQNFMLYELSWYFSGDRAAAKNPTAATGAVAREFVETLRGIAPLLDPDVIARFGTVHMLAEVREILAHTLRGEAWGLPYVVRTRNDEVHRLVRVKYRFCAPDGTQPDIAFMVGARRITPAAHKVRTIVYFEQPLEYEYIAWIREEPGMRVLVDGQRLPLLAEEPPVPAPAPRRGGRPTAWTAINDLVKTLTQGATPRKAMVAAWRAVTAVIGNADIITWAIKHRSLWTGHLWALVRNLAVRLTRRAGVGGHEFDGAWIVMDSPEDADDNGERLFRWIRTHRPDINAWFVLRRGVPDWRKLRREGFGDHLVAYGTYRWMQLAAQAKHLVSSSANTDVVSPVDLWWMPKRWHYTFLQHGVIKDDISRWLNPKVMDGFVTSTPAETESIAGDGTPYSFTSREVKMVGLARFDRLRELGRLVPESARDLVVVAPTWRQELSVPLPGASTRVGIRDGFEDTEFGRNWLGLLRSESFLGAVRRAGKRVAFLPHPNLQPMLDKLSLPPEIRVIRYGRDDIQDVLAHAAIMVTDYSSQAFNAGFLGRPVVYFQFDRQAFFSGESASRVGYFSYERDGFGPVVETLDDVVPAVERMLAGVAASLPEAGRAAADAGTPDQQGTASDAVAEYVGRMDRTFQAVRDGKCCERTVAMIEAIES
ncbi:MAG: bifunctional glycosyltransferase family 2 protein/CDP-glycerol:glycerophosphate glycerophosphotransferase, partial [Bifidobacteriaceae bacterium]|nr:bifunctional glycosyltransferase family 2 protein/CDP-glycerol:glycerophosphate glycerophosphotransferase [Bifidobacteriaceae bacterium]